LSIKIQAGYFCSFATTEAMVEKHQFVLVKRQGPFGLLLAMMTVVPGPSQGKSPTK
jgi:hypothetical protein